MSTQMATATCLLPLIRSVNLASASQFAIKRRLLWQTQWSTTFFLSDLGPEFMGAVVEELFHILGVTHLKTCGYRPQTNGGCEV